ncbi:MAG TPA: maleylpyruvate isomerase N-terminal domain-containing protein [Streptosporangiaceae bacterium]|nr:maleylpyruvate isomerase N-terminal domain-containing protein [Streptosporangiaceae bacterium]
MSESAGPHSAELMIGRIDESVGRVLESVTTLSDDQVRAPSLLPGWTRGHVLAHIARNADGLRNLLTWARTGVSTPQYANFEAREAEIEDGAGRPAAEQADDIATSAKAFTELARELPPEAWLAEVQGMKGPLHPAWFVLERRLFELEVHHVDLHAGYRSGDWPDWFVTDQLYRITGELTQNPDAPSAILNDLLTGRQFWIGTAETKDLEISGHGHVLLAWLIGRSEGEELTADPAGPLPGVPAY